VRKQRGLASVELAIVAVAFLTIVLGAIEFSRLLFSWNMLDAVTQRAARIAAVCDPDEVATVKTLAMFNNDGESSFLLPNLEDDNLQIVYLDDNFVDTGGAFPIAYVRASIVNYQHRLAIPFISSDIVSSPTFVTTIPSESLGYVPDTGQRTC